MTRRGARVLAKFQRGAIGRVSNIEAQEPSPIIDEAQEAASADLGARFVTTTQKENSPMIRAAQEAASTDSEVPAGTTLGTKEAQESALMIQDTSRYV